MITKKGAIALINDTEQENITLGQLIKEVRLAASLTQLELAEILKVSQQRISEWENGKFKPKAESRKNIAAACGVDDKTLILLLSL